ncbi:phosphoribosyltransferase family protein [Rhodoferax sp. GW822-FHT02A01]|uniref:ComF family protein n=1 Tax=Rhodoferax sp. GW822-FHT02A01 TaxID=3141537 RepID=UPI00315CA26C
MPDTLMQCGTCVAEPPPLDAVLAAVTYDFPWAGLIVQFKFHQGTGWAPGFAALMRSMPWVEPALDCADWVIPMPLSPTRLQQRGFNQALELARGLGTSKLQHDVLLRIKEAPPQSTLPRKERLTNVRGAYALAPEFAPAAKGKRIVLVDDVMTTGASLHAAARALRRAGAAHITAIVLARAE